MSIFEKAEILQNKILIPVDILLTSLKNSFDSVADLIKIINEIVLNKNIDEIESDLSIDDVEFFINKNSNTIN